MTVTDAVKTMMKDKRMTQATLAEKIDAKQTNIAMYLKSNNAIRVENLMRMANACGYDLVLIDREDARKVLVIGEGESADLSAIADADLDDRIRRIVEEELLKRGVEDL